MAYASINSPVPLSECQVESSSGATHSHSELPDPYLSSPHPDAGSGEVWLRYEGRRRSFGEAAC